VLLKKARRGNLKLFMIPKYKLVKTLYVALILSVFFFDAAFAQSEIVDFRGTDILIGKNLEIAEDPGNSFTIENVNKKGNFVKSTSEVPNFGLTKSAWWLKFTIKNSTKDPVLFLELSYPMIHSMELYERIGTRNIRKSISENDPFSKREIKHQNLVFELNVAEGENKTYYLKVRENTQIVLPFIVRNEASFNDASMTGEVLNGIYVGALVVMILYNLFVFLSVKEKNYIYYVMYILFIGLAQTTITGYTFKFLWPDSPEFTNLATVLFSALAGCFAVLFFRSFLNTAEQTPVLDKGLFGIVVLYVLALVFQLTDNEAISFMLTNFAGGASVFLAILISSILSLKNVRSAKFFLLAWSIFFIGLALFILRNLNLLPFNSFTNYTMQAGTAIEVVLLSFALADKINILKKETEESQAQALSISLENQKIIREQNIFLEKSVNERTAELQLANTDLNVAMTQLKDAQSQLIDSEKMASLGQLTAGIAHEINNPINFVSSNIKPLRRDIDDLMQILSSYNELSDVDSLPEIKEKIKLVENLKDELDLEYIKTELEMLLKGMEDGAHRTVEIVKGLKIFSRLDDTDLNHVNINEGLESTLVILNYQLGNIKVQRELGDIPSVEGYGGKLNQVFMNILTNSIYALQKNTNAESDLMITVKTRIKDDNHVVISLKDNGTGMSPEVKAKIFDPFFTTKDVGEGTGLGLSIVFKIIEVHHGEIEVFSELGKGQNL